MIRTCDEQGIIVYYKCDTLVYRRGIGMKGREENPVLVNDADAVPACLPCACVCACVCDMLFLLLPDRPADKRQMNGMSKSF